MKKDIILFLGQSNMQGQTERLSESEPVENATEYKFLTDRLVPLKNPAGEAITKDLKEGFNLESMDRLGEWLSLHALGRSSHGNTNMLPEFCRAYIKESGHSVVAVHAAKGSTKIDFWSPNTDGYNAVVQKALGAIKKVGKENISGVYCVWLQGESDALSSTDTDEYLKRLIEIKNGLKRDVGLKKFGIIKVGAFACDGRDEAIFKAQERACDIDEDFIMLTRITKKLLADEKFLNPNAFGHYGSYGQEVLGRSAGKNLALALAGSEFDTEEMAL